MTDRFVEVARRGWGGNVKRRASGMAIGMLLLVVAFPLLWWNEGKLQARHAGLDWITRTVETVSPNEVARRTEGQPIYLSGEVLTDETLSDDVFGVQLTRLLRLKRTVEMYQWQENKSTRTHDTPGGGSETITEYSYSKVWSDKALDSGKFHHQGYDNPAMPLRSRTVNAGQAHIGEYRLGDNVIGRLNDFQPLSLSSGGVQAPEGFRPVSDSQLYRGAAPEQPQLGDLRIGFGYVPLQTISIIATQLGNQLGSVVTPNDQKFLLVGAGPQSIAQLVTAQRHKEELFAWLIRGLGLLFILIGIQSLFSLLGALLGFIPFVRMLAGGIGFVAGLLLSITLGISTIALAWLYYRPGYALGLLGIAVATLVLSGWFGRRAIVKRRRPPHSRLAV